MFGKKEKKIIITFHTMAESIAFENECKKLVNVKELGRLIPVPREISSGCGISWCAPLDKRSEIEHILENNSLEWEAVHEIEI
ncbi:MAG: DUF3343 domain-containing protein [Eubacteriales bacterium]|nr:DUF3343 domain-containing protein [Eubacteriales bacterium]MDY3332623.1 DUF3343 domain-containing protein [Gallibacter sp.]